MVFMSGLETFCSSFSPTLGLSSCVAGVFHFMQSMTDVHLQHLFQTKLALPCRSLHLTGPVNKMSILWNGSAEKCHVKQDNKFTCKHFRHTCIKTSNSIFHHFLDTPKRKQVSLIYDDIYSEHTRRVGEANTLTYKYIFNQNV